MKISAIVIVKNAENLLVDCLESLSFCSEIILIDNGSEGRAVDLGKKLGAKVFSLITNDFSALRNFGKEKSTSDWVLYVDVDERVTPELASNIKHQILSMKDEQSAAFKLKRKNFYLGNQEWPYIEKLERLFKKDKLKKWQGELHESAVVDGKIGEIDGFLLHFTHRDLTSMLNKTIEWSDIEAKLRFDHNHPKMTWWRFPRVMLWAFFDSYVKQGGYKAGVVGLIESIYQSFSMFITYAKLWEMQDKRRS